MDEFLEKWRTDNKFKAKIKLGLYLIFIIFVIIYAMIIERNKPKLQNNNEPKEEEKNIISNNLFPFLNEEEYTYTIEIEINDSLIKYIYNKTSAEEKITKISNNETKEYVYKDNEYYQNLDGVYTKTTQSEVYDKVKHNYINPNIINQYINKSTEEENQYKVYLKDIILGNESDIFFTITKNDNTIFIDYTPLMNEFNNSIEKYTVNYIIETKE